MRAAAAGGLRDCLAEQRRAADVFLGRLVVLFDGRSFSTTAGVAAQLRSMGRAVFVGEETGGGYEGNTSGLNADVILPSSKLRLRITIYDDWNAVKPPVARGRGTQPDYLASPRVRDLLAGRDGVLERALQVLR